MKPSIVFTHLCIGTREALRWDSHRLAGLFIDEAGRHCTAAYARELLQEHLIAGRKVLPIGTPCEGFSYQTGCPGHPIPEEAEATTHLTATR